MSNMKRIHNIDSFGGFASSIGDAWCRADSHNRDMIEHQWPHLFEADHGSIVWKRAKGLVEYADEHGFVVTIDLKPKDPLAMGNYEHVVNVREARSKE